jgi:hypothetical protein
MERQYEEAVNEGIRIDSERVGLLSYRLLTMFLASKGLSELRDGEYDSGADILSQHEQPEIEHSLIQIAILYRIADDNARAGRSFNGPWNPVVGKLYPDVSKEQSEELNLREACNKIIHLTKLKYNMIEGEYSWQSYVQPTLYLYGRKDSQEWKAVLDVKEFCGALSRLET